MTSLTTSRHWANINEAGTMLGMRFLMGVYRVFGRRFYSVLLYPIGLYFFLFRPEARRASIQYLHQHHAYSPTSWTGRPHYRHVILHFKNFAEVILDKMLGWVIEINESDFNLEDPQQVEKLLSDSRGQLIIGSHFGNLEFCRGFMQRYQNKVINILVYDKHSANFIELMKKENPASRLNVFQVDDFNLSILSQLQNKVAQGEWVFIAGDRTPLSGMERTIPVQFLGKTAMLPMGPYLLAKALQCPVYSMFAYRKSFDFMTDTCAQKKHCQYYFSVSLLAERIDLPRKNRSDALKSYAQHFASELEHHCIHTPYQWFNFYDFWSDATYIKNANL